MTPTFRPARSIPGLKSAFRSERTRIQALLPSAVVIHTGATSLPDLLTLGDLDIHVPVPVSDFSAARSALDMGYAPHRPEMWTDGFAAYTAEARPLPVGLVLTAIGGEHDRRFTVSWQRLAADPELVSQYNALKLRHASGSAAEYEADKSAFFSRLSHDDG